MKNDLQQLCRWHHIENQQHLIHILTSRLYCAQRGTSKYLDSYGINCVGIALIALCRSMGRGWGSLKVTRNGL